MNRKHQKVLVSGERSAIQMKEKLTCSWLIAFFLLPITTAFGQGDIDTLFIKEQLAIVYDRDQTTRQGDSLQLLEYYDSTNQAFVFKLIQDYGWPGRSFVGDHGNYTVWLVIQHAELDIQEKYFPLLAASVDQGQSQPSHLALLQDRILMRKNLPQVYGSQVIFNDQTGAPEFYKIADEENVNTRRQSVGLEPIEVYAEHFGIVYEIKKANLQDKR